MSMSKLEIIQRARIRVREVQQLTIQELEKNIGAVIDFLNNEELRISKEELTNGSPTIVEAEVIVKGGPERE